MTDVVLPLLVLQFLIAAVMWVGTLPRWMTPARPGMQDPTRMVLPLLMIVAGLLFFSRPLAPLWGPGLGLPDFPGIPEEVGRWVFMGANLAVTGMLVGRTGGTPGSPFVPLLVAVPCLVWIVGLPVGEVVASAGVALGILGFTFRWPPEAGETPQARWIVGALSLGVLGVGALLVR